MEYIFETVKDIYYKKTTDKPFYRDAVRGIVLNENDEVALIHLLGSDDFGKRDHYELPGGGIEDGETDFDTMKREMIEEIGYEVSDLKEVGKIAIEYNLIERVDIEHYILAKKGKFVGKHLTDFEKTIFDKVIWVKKEELVKFYSDHQTTMVGDMIHKRDLEALRYALKI